MTNQEIYELVLDLRERIAYIQNQIEHDRIVIEEDTIDTFLWDAQEALSKIQTKVYTNPYL
jgi:hypothetical protein